MRKICFCLAVLTVLFFAVSCDSKGSGAKAAENTGNDGDTVSTNDDDSTETTTDDSDTVDDSEITDSGDSRPDENDTTPDEDSTDTEAAGDDEDTACDEDLTDTEAAGGDEDTACDEDLTDAEVSDGDEDAVEPVNDAPVAGHVDWNVSISSLLRSPSFDFNTVVSDIDNDDWMITALVLGEIAVDVEGTQTTVTVNNIDLQAVYDPTAKTLTLAAPDGVDLTVLDKHSLALAYTVSDNSTSGELTADGTGTVAITV